MKAVILAAGIGSRLAPLTNDRPKVLVDVLGNVAVPLAALGVFGTGTGWPDTTVADIMAALALQGACTVIGHSWSELRAPHALQAAR